MSHLLTCFHKRHSPLNNLVQVLYYPVIGIHTPYQTCYGGLKLCLQYASNLLILRHVPDPQSYTKFAANQPLFDLQTAWIAQNIEPLNIKAALFTGDMVEQTGKFLA